MIVQASYLTTYLSQEKSKNELNLCLKKINT